MCLAIGHSGVTGEDELSMLGRRLFGPRFIGVFAIDELPSTRAGGGGMLICNLDTREQPGSHWVAIADDWMYDSFGRSLGFSGMHNPEDDSEQDVREENCGQRSLAWLCVYYVYGPKGAKFI